MKDKKVTDMTESQLIKYLELHAGTTDRDGVAWRDYPSLPDHCISDLRTPAQEIDNEIFQKNFCK